MLDHALGILGVVVGLLGLAYGHAQGRAAKRQGTALTTFLIGLKAAQLPEKAIPQIDDMIGRLK